MRVFQHKLTVNETSHNDSAAVTINPAGANNSLTFTAATAGKSGNDITVTYVDPGETATLGVVVTGPAIVVNLGYAAGAITTTGTLLSSAIEAEAAAAALVTVADAGGDTGAGLVTAMAIVSLAGGTNFLYSDAVDLSIMNNVTAVQLHVNATTLNGLATLDITTQYSYDKVTWFAGTAFTQLTTTEGSEIKYINPVSAAIGTYLRFKFDVNTVVPVLAALTTTLTGANNDLVWTAVDGGTQGNYIYVEYLNPGTAGATISLDVTSTPASGGYTKKVISVNLATTAAVKASYTTTLTGANNDIVLTAVAAGTAGNAIDIILADPSANNAALSVGTVGTVITVNLATGVAGAITSTASQVLAAINGDYLAQKLVLVTLSGADDGTGVVTALAKQDLASGSAGAVINSTGDAIKTALLADAEAAALVTAADAGGNDGSGAVIAMAEDALLAGADNVVLEMSLLAV